LLNKYYFNFNYSFENDLKKQLENAEKSLEKNIAIEQNGENIQVK
jgi:hypothetical protein